MKKSYYLALLTVFLSYFISYGQEYSIPLQGEGIHAFLKRNDRLRDDNFEKFKALNRDKLGKDLVLKSGVHYLLPNLPEDHTTIKQDESVSTGKQPLFGEQLAEYTITSNLLKGACFFLSSGHGGPDPGATTTIDNVELHEDEYAYDITLRLALNLLKQGATVHIIIQDEKDGIRDDKYLANSDRETCMGDAIPLNNKLRLQQRCDKINELSRQSDEKYKRAVFIHLDSRPKNKPVDIFFYHWEDSPKGKQLATTLKETIHSKYNKSQPNRGFDGTVSPRSLYVLHYAAPVGVFIELGNICNDGRDRKRFLEYNNRQAIANWLCEGFIKDYQENNAQE